MANVGTAAAGKTLIGAGNGSSPTYASIGTNSGLAAHGVLIAEGNSPFVVASPGITGTILMSNGAGSDPSFQNGGSFLGNTITGDSGGALPPTAGNWNIIGSGSTVTSGSGSTLTVQLTGLTNHSVLVGAGTTTITKVGPTATAGQVLQSAGAAADPVFSTATYPSTTTISQILYSSSANVVAGLATANSATLVTTSTGVPVMSATMTNGQMIIGSTGATPAAGTITSTGGTIAVTTGAGTLNLEVATGGFVWNDVSGAFSPLKENGYFITATATGTLPAAPAQGDTIKFFVDTTQILTIQATAGKIIRLGSLVSSSGGTFVSSLQGDSVELTYRTSDTCWCAIAGFTGTWTLT